MKKFLSLLLVAVMLLSLVACGNAKEKEEEPTGPRVLKASIAHSEGSPVYTSLLRLAEELEEKSNGELTVEVFPNTQLSGGNQTTAIEMTQSGEIEIGIVSNVVECAVIPSLNLISVPFIWDDEAMVDAALTRGSEAFDLYYEDFASKDLILLGFAESGFREITNDIRPIKTPEDMDNLKIRVLGNNMLNAAYTALGANPTDYNFNELYTALQQGTVDGQENPISTCLIPQRFEEVQDYLTICRIAYDAQVIQMGKPAWDSLTESQQKVLQECLDDFVIYERETNRAVYAEDIKGLEDGGMDVTILTNEEVQPFKEAVQGVVDEYAPQYNKDIYDAILACK